MVWNSSGEDERALYVGEPATGLKSSRGRKCAVVVLGVALVAILLVTIVPVTLRLGSSDITPTGVMANPSSITAACAATQYPETCSDTLQNSTHTNAQVFTLTTVAAASDGVTESHLYVKNSKTPQNRPAVEVCMDVLSSASEELGAVKEMLGTRNATELRESFDEIKTRLTAAMEFHTTCMDALEEVGGEFGASVRAVCDQTNEIFSVALSFVNAFAAFGDDLRKWATSAGIDLSRFNDHHRRLLNADDDESAFSDGEEDAPEWVSHEQRRRLLTTSKPAAGSYNVMVTWKGSGNFRNVMDAVNNAPIKSKRPYVIYIKSGTYREQVKINSSHRNIVFIGDGARYTTLTGNLSVALTPNMTTFLTPTLIVAGEGFLAKGITFQNTAGPRGHQAVAVRVSADKAAFYQCNFDSYQDTLYVHNYRQFYRDCQIMGTIDYIFGNAWAVFQNCRLIARKSTLAGQTNIYTAQGKTDRGQSTGLSFQSCVFDATNDLIRNKKAFKTFLGRPWKPFSTAILLRSTIQGHVEPQGWMPWNASDYGLRTSFFAEFQSLGVGANVTARVPWSKQIITVAEANKYQANNFIQGDKWLRQTNFPYTTALLK